MAWFALVALAACGKGSPARSDHRAGVTDERLPVLRPGLWLQTVERDGKPARAGRMRVCVDAATDARMTMMGRAVSRSRCRQTIERGSAQGGYRFVSRCDMGGAGSFVSRGDLSGDFATAWRLHAQSEVTGSIYPPLNGRHVTDVAARYLGACPADMAPGDVVLGPGMKVNIDRMPLGAAAALVG